MADKDFTIADQSSTFPYRLKNGIIEFCLITSRKKRRWGLPKGTIEPGESSIDAALRESYEEAGVYGQISGNILGRYEYKKRGRIRLVDVWLMQVTKTDEHWKEEHQRNRRWVNIESARELLKSRRKFDELIMTALERISKSSNEANLGPSE